MLKNILVTLVITGKDLHNNLSLALVKQGEGKYTLPSMTLDCVADEDAIFLAIKHIKAPVDWYEVRRKTFLQEGDTIYLVYGVVLPNDTAIKDCEWIKIQEVHGLIEDNGIIRCAAQGLR